MMKRLLVALAIVVASVTSLATPVVISPATAYAGCGDGFFGLPPWYRNLTEGDCEITKPADDPNGLARFIGTILLNLLEGAFIIAGYVALFFILKGGFLYIVSTGASDKMASAKKTLMNAIIGLVICILAAMVVNALSAALAG